MIPHISNHGVPSSLFNVRLEEMSAHERVLEGLKCLDLSVREVTQICENELDYSSSETRKLLGELGLILTAEHLTSQYPAVQATIEKLRSWRSVRARIEGVPAYRILSNRVLLSVATKVPRTKADLMEIKGIGSKTAEAYADDLMLLLNCVS